MQHTRLFPKIIAQRRRPHENRHDLAESPRRFVELVIEEILQENGEEVEAVKVYAEEDQAENSNADTQDPLGAFGAFGQRLFERNMELFQCPLVYVLLPLILGAAEVIDDENDCCEDTECKYDIRAVVGIWRTETRVEV